MYDVQISEVIYQKVAQAAETSQTSLQEFVEMALLNELEAAKPVKLSAHQLDLIRESQVQIQAGLGISVEEATEELMSYRKQWRDEQAS